MIFRTFGWSFLFTIVGVLGALWYGGIEGVALASILIVLEISLSFDNAVVNAKVLERMSEFWRKMFLTVGILIAVFGMRLIFPFLLVSASAGISPWARSAIRSNLRCSYSPMRTPRAPLQKPTPM